MRDEILGTAQDIEQLLKLGRETHACPYYSTRLAVPPAQVTLSSDPPFLWCHYFGDCLFGVLCHSCFCFFLATFLKVLVSAFAVYVWSMFVSTVGGVALSAVAS